jgi:hypothetical protein
MHGTYIETIKKVYLFSAAKDTPKILIFKNNHVSSGLVLNTNGKTTGTAQAATPS